MGKTVTCKNCGYSYVDTSKKNTECATCESCPNCTRKFPDDAVKGIIAKYLPKSKEINLDEGLEDKGYVRNNNI